MQGLKILSTGMYAPKEILDNNDLEKMVETSDEWIMTRTGIKRRHISQEGTVELAVKAAKAALKDIDLSRLGIIIVATMSPDYYTPSCACLVQAELGLASQQIMAFDISAACSGYVYGLTIMQALLRTMPEKLGLLIGAEHLSKLVDYQDRSTCILFGDGAGATVMAAADNLFVSYNDSKGNIQLLNAPALADDKHYLTMAGQEVFKFAIKVIPESINQVLTVAQLDLADVDYIVCHQANKRIIQHVYKKLRVEERVFYMNLEEYGNTSGASIPMALAEMDQKGLLKEGMKIICVGFGGGLTWGATLLEW